MAGIYAPDGSYNVTLVAGGTEVSTTGGTRGIYAPDGSYRVTIVGVSDGGAVVNQDDPTTVTDPVGADPHPAFINVTGGVVSAQLISGGIVDTADVIAVRNSAGADSHNGTASVTGTGTVRVNLPSGTVMVDNADVVPIKNSSGSITIANGAASVAGTVLQSVNLPATASIVQNGVEILMPAITGTYVDGYTFTVVNGVVTAITAS